VPNAVNGTVGSCDLFLSAIGHLRRDVSSCGTIRRQTAIQQKRRNRGDDTDGDRNGVVNRLVVAEEHVFDHRDHGGGNSDPDEIDEE